jgi:hypothetical protein
VQRFKDCIGREWEVAIKLPDLSRLKAVGCDLDVLCDGEGVSFHEKYLSLSLPVKVAALWELCRKQRQDVNEDSFAEGFDGDALEAAMLAFCGAVVDFFRKPKMVHLWSNRLRIMDAEKTVVQKQIDHRLTLLRELDGASLERLASTQAT